MKPFKFLLLILFSGLGVLSLTFSYSNGIMANVWDEGNRELTKIEHGIPSYNEATIVYRRDGKPVLEVELQAPIIVSVASKPEGWGFHQFPSLYRSAEGPLAATWSYAEDIPASFGVGQSFFALSSDNGKTWNLSDQPEKPLGDGIYALRLPENEGYISARNVPALKESELQLPPPVATHTVEEGNTYTFYRMSELPEALQGAYLNRWDGNGVWSEIHAGLDDPGLVRYSIHGICPVVWWGDMKLLPDKSIVACIHPVSYERETGGVTPMAVSLYRSTDYGMNWKIQGKIPYHCESESPRCLYGYQEPAFEILTDGSFLCVMRNEAPNWWNPMHVSRSTDQGVTWSRPLAVTPNGVMPRLLQLDNGVLVLSSGRPGVQVRFSLDGKGEMWTDPFEMIPPFADEGWDVWNKAASCGYTDLLAAGPDSFFVIYSDFRHLNQNNEERKAIKVRKIKVTKLGCSREMR
ncbi:MAG: glycoside hydrolase [Planctomycetaceae bacterium]|nr:glycoside hydrolase [Planctomycetaceae bacterium]